MESKDCMCPAADFSWWKLGGHWDRQRISLSKVDAARKSSGSPWGFPSAEFDVAIINPDLKQRCERCRHYLVQTIGVPSDLLVEYYCTNSNGFFACQETLDDEGNLTAFDTWVRFIFKYLEPNGVDYGWHYLNFFARWLPGSNKTIIVNLEVTPPFDALLTDALAEGTEASHLADPFWVYARLGREVTFVHDKIVWSLRGHIRKEEKLRKNEANHNPDFLHLHDLARHAIHVVETLEVAEVTMHSIIAQHEAFTTRGAGSAGTGGIGGASRYIRNRLLFYEHMATSLRLRSVSNKQRLENEIQLAFNTVAQYDSRVSVKIGRAAQQDSAAMKTVAVLTLVFLPPTFISAVFSMSFFNFEGDAGEWAVSDQFWLYWAVAVPTTVVAAGAWYAWQRMFPPVLIGEEKGGDRGWEGEEEGKGERRRGGVREGSVSRKNVSRKGGWLSGGWETLHVDLERSNYI